ncbi:MAG: PEP-CTERM sorting domain-containing protein [Candidatus Korobacteraceae bacterium]
MKLHIASLAVLCLTLAAVPALAQGNVYDNGPLNGEVDSFTINFGFSVTDSFTVSNNNGNIGGMDFVAWLDPGDVNTSVEIQIGNQAFGNNLMDMTVALTQSGCFPNDFGFDVCHESSTFNGPDLSNGTYWVTLSNAVNDAGDPTYWDQNSGEGCMSPGCPSQAENDTGSIPSETFTLTAQGTTSTGTTPEPNSILLFASGFLGVAGILRRKLF